MEINKVVGVDKLIAKLKSIKKQRAQQFSIGVKKASALLLRYSLPLVPVQFGILRSTGDIRSEGSGFKTIARTSYGTNYAAFVHEIEEYAHGEDFNTKHAEKIAKVAKYRKKHKLAKDKYWFNRGPKQRSKFLEAPFREHRQELINVIKQEVK